MSMSPVLTDCTSCFKPNAPFAQLRHASSRNIQFCYGGQAMKILLVHQAFASTADAGGTRHYEFARRLSSQGHQTRIITSSTNYLSSGKRADVHQQEAGLDVVSAWTLPARGSAFLSRLVSLLAFMLTAFFRGVSTRRLDIVWATSPPIFQAASAYAIAKIRRKPLLLEVRDLWPDFAVDVGVLTNSIAIRAARWLERTLYRGADLIVINSPGFESHIQSKGIEPDRIRLVPNGVDTTMFDPDQLPAAARERLGLGDGFIVMYTGAHGIANDLDVLIDAAHLLRDDPDVRIVLVGNGRERDRLKQRVSEEQLLNVSFVEAQPKAAMATWLAAADVCIATLKPIKMFTTTYPNKVFDYMAAGKPTIVAIDGVIRAVVEEARAGTFVEPGSAPQIADAIRKYKEEPGREVEEGRNARKAVVEQFDRKAHASLFEQALEDARDRAR